MLLEGTEAGGAAPAAPRRRSASSLANPGRASLFPDAVIGAEGALGRGQRAAAPASSTSQTLDAAGRALAPLAPVLLPLRPDPDARRASASRWRPALDGQRPNTISLANDGQFWPAGEIDSDGGPVRFTIAAAEPSTLQSLTGYDGKAYLGELVAVRAGKPHRIVPLSAGLRRLDRLVRIARSRPRQA